MQSIWLSLLWKEWREYRWKLAALSVVILAPPFLFTAMIEANSLEVFIQILLGTLLSYGFLAGMFLGMGVAARENGVGTIAFLKSLPNPMWKAAAAKLLVASVVATTPIVLLLVISYGCYRAGFFYFENITHFFASMNVDPAVPWTVADWFLRCLLAAVVGTLSLLWWAAALGVNRSDEIRAGAVAFLGIAAIWFCGFYLLYLSDKHHLRILGEGLVLVTAAAPAGMLALINPNTSGALAEKPAAMIVAFSMIALIGHAGVLGWFLYRFGRVSPKTGRGDELQGKAIITGSLKAPFKSQLTAIVWKQMRETGPLALVALAAILAIAGFASWVTPNSRETFSQMFLAMGGSMSFFVVMVTGIGLYLDELQPGLNHFWRSRPNDFRLWFGVKFLAGILVMVTVLGIPLFLAGWSQWNEEYNPEWKELWGDTLFGVWFFVLTYSLAMTYQCLVRQPLYAAILTFATIFFGFFALKVSFEVFNLEFSHLVQIVAAMILPLVGTVFLAWKTVKHDWGWKQ